MARPKTASNLPLLIGIIGIVAVLGILAGVWVAFGKGAQAPEGQAMPSGQAEIVDGVQVVRIAVNGLDFVPATVQVKAGMPVRMIVDGTDAQGCAQYFMFREFGLSKKLDKGENVFEFTPTTAGTYEFSCSMRMAIGRLQVV